MHRRPPNPNFTYVSSASTPINIAHATNASFFTPLKIDEFLPHDYYMIIFGATH